jgi:hypothetical protein
MGNFFLISVFRSKKSEMDWVVKRSGADHSNMSEACLKLRGLPFGCSKEEIAQFFTGKLVLTGKCIFIALHCLFGSKKCDLEWVIVSLLCVFTPKETFGNLKIKNVFSFTHRKVLSNSFTKIFC